MERECLGRKCMEATTQSIAMKIKESPRRCEKSRLEQVPLLTRSRICHSSNKKTCLSLYSMKCAILKKWNRSRKSIAYQRWIKRRPPSNHRFIQFKLKMFRTKRSLTSEQQAIRNTRVKTYLCRKTERTSTKVTFLMSSWRPKRKRVNCPASSMRNTTCLWWCAMASKDLNTTCWP